MSSHANVNECLWCHDWHFTVTLVRGLVMIWLIAKQSLQPVVHDTISCSSPDRVLFLTSIISHKFHMLIWWLATKPHLSWVKCTQSGKIHTGLWQEKQYTLNLHVQPEVISQMFRDWFLIQLLVVGLAVILVGFVCFLCNPQNDKSLSF